jgi:hypothetical protein
MQHVLMSFLQKGRDKEGNKENSRKINILRCKKKIRPKAIKKKRKRKIGFCSALPYSQR